MFFPGPSYKPENSSAYIPHFSSSDPIKHLKVHNRCVAECGCVRISPTFLHLIWLHPMMWLAPGTCRYMLKKLHNHSFHLSLWNLGPVVAVTVSISRWVCSWSRALAAPSPKNDPSSPVLWRNCVLAATTKTRQFPSCQPWGPKEVSFGNDGAANLMWRLGSLTQFLDKPGAAGISISAEVVCISGCCSWTRAWGQQSGVPSACWLHGLKCWKTVMWTIRMKGTLLLYSYLQFA